MNAVTLHDRGVCAGGLKRPVLRWLGGKYRLAEWIIGFFPAHDQYLEPYGGGGSVLLQKARAYNETFNDLDGEIVNLFRVLRGPDGAELLRLLALTPYAREEYRLALQLTDDPLERARRLIVRSHMAHGTGGARLDRPTGFRINGVSGSTNVAGEWANLPQALEYVRERLRGVVIEQKPALSLVEAFNDSNVLIYLDPPYMPETRSTKSRKPGERYHTYAFELTDGDHRALLEVCRASKAMIVLSGYPHDLYDVTLGAGWVRRERQAKAHRNSPRTECLWLSPITVAALGQGRLL